MICMNVGEKIVKIRKEKGLSQIELAKKCNILYQTLGKYERGLLNPKLETIKKIAKALEIPYTQLIDDENFTEILSENEKRLISKIFQAYYCDGISKIAESDEVARSIFIKLGII